MRDAHFKHLRRNGRNEFHSLKLIKNAIEEHLHKWKESEKTSREVGKRLYMSPKLAICDATYARSTLHFDNLLYSTILLLSQLINGTFATIVVKPAFEEHLWTLERTDVICSEGWVEMHVGNVQELAMPIAVHTHTHVYVS